MASNLCYWLSSTPKQTSQKGAEHCSTYCLFLKMFNVLTIFNEQVRVHLIEFIIGLWQCSPPLKTTLTLSEHDASKSKRICPKNSKILLIIQILYELNLFTVNRKWFGYNYRVRRLSVWVRRLCENWFLSVSIYLQVGSLIRIHNIISVWSKPLSLCDT